MRRVRSRVWVPPLAIAIIATSLALLANPPAAAADRKDSRKAKHSKVDVGPAGLPKGRTGPLALREPPVSSPVTAAAGVAPPNSVDLRVLVISADGAEATLPAIRQALDYVGVPFDQFTAAPVPADPARNRLADPEVGGVRLAEGDLATSTRGRYNAVILATGSLGYAGEAGFQSALTPAEWSYLWAYEARFDVRQVSWYAYPTADLGFAPPTEAVDTSSTPLVAPFTAAGQEIFSSYVNTATPVSIKNAYTYLAQPLADGMTTPLLSDASGNALAAVRDYPDGREGLALTFDSNAYLLHNLVLSYGLVSWATRGLYLGARRVYLSAQIDDLFIDNTLWQPETACGTSVDDPSLPVYRMTGNDLALAEAWQAARRAEPATRALRLNMAFNGVGTTSDYYSAYAAARPGVPADDTLTSRARSSQGLFNWISHTHTHANLDAITGSATKEELERNHDVANGLGLARYSKANLVQPDVSGLSNPSFLSAASSFGVRDLVSDVSRGGTNANPSPNAGVVNALEPKILQIPRRANNLYFNVSTPAEWLAEDNCIYPSGAFGHVDTYDQLLERESTVLLSYMLLGDIDPWMFHQANLRVYDGTRSLLTDLLGRTLDKYSTHFTLPVVSPTMEELALRMSLWMGYVASGAAATATGTPASVPIVVSAARPAIVPITGVQGAFSEEYGGQFTTLVAVSPSSPVTIGPSATLSPGALDFGTVRVDKNSGTRKVALTNVGNQPLNVRDLSTTGDFSQTNDCGQLVAAGARCTITVVFRPRESGVRTGALVVSSDVPTRPSSVALTGTGGKKK